MNGTLIDVPDNITFARSQYAQRIDNDPFYQQLLADLLSRPLVFIGSGLDEAPLWEHIVSRRTKGDRRNQELRPRSYLVTPTLNKSKDRSPVEVQHCLAQNDWENNLLMV